MKMGQLAYVSFLCVFVFVTLIVCPYIFEEQKHMKPRGKKIKLGKRNSDNHLGIILFKLQIIN